MPLTTKHCGWASPIQEFLSVDLATWGKALVAFHQSELNEFPSLAQKRAWKDCFECLHHYLPHLLERLPQAASWTIIFEYELPRESGRRPDVIILGGGEIYVLEFKQWQHVEQAHVDQVSAYARDIKNYHGASREHLILPILVLTRTTDLQEQQEDVWAVSPERLERLFVSSSGDKPIIDPVHWLEANYEPLPALVDAARRLFQNEPLSRIRRADSAGIPDTVNEIKKIAECAQNKKEHHLVLVTGVPGAGKTLVGLQLAYDSHAEHAITNRSAIFLSGNGPLVAVLQDALKSKVFVQSVHSFLRTYGGNANARPTESVLIFDEAQRAWDEERSRAYGRQFSEPEQFLQIGAKKEWCVMVGLIGEGQEIHLGEETGIEQWNTAVTRSRVKWTIHCPEKLREIFIDQGVQASDRLNLTVSLRSHLAKEVQSWGHAVLEGDCAEAARLSDFIREDGFEIYITDNLEKAKEYVRNRYENQYDKRYGMMVSSQAENHKDISSGKMSYPAIASWYNAVPNEQGSCCQLKKAASEFESQGLELDFPILCWGDDLTWLGKWVNTARRRSNARDPHRLRINTYRVLLSRGRDGMIIYVPSTPTMKSTYQILIESGATILN